MSKKFFFLSFFLFCLASPLQAEIITVTQEPAELKHLRSTYREQMTNSSTPEKLKQLQKEFEAAKEKSLQAPALKQKITSLENSRDIEVKKTQTLYNDRIEALTKEAMDSVERKYQVIFDTFKDKSGKNVKNQYILDLKRLEDKLIRQNNLAGALVVQTERNKAMGISAASVSVTPASKAAEPPTQPAVPKRAAKKSAEPAPEAAPVQPTAAPSPKMSAAHPQIYASQTRGLAGSGSNVAHNVYAFDIPVFGNQTWLSFNGYGRDTNHSFGEVYLITPAGQRHQVASWSPDQLKANNYYGVKSAKDVQSIRSDISQLMTSSGTYQVEFTYKDGNEPLTIYQVEIKTW